jgi:molybdopterin converting factor subunit 1
MKITILAFGIAKDIIGQTETRVDTSESSVKALREQLLAAYPGFEKLASLRLAVNEEYRDDDYLLNEGDEVAIIPPVSGG